MDQFGICPLRPTARAKIDLVWKAADGNWDGNAFNAEIRELVFPVETGSGNRRVRQPGDRDVVEDIVPSEPSGLSSEDTRDQCIAPGIVVEKIGSQADGRICNSVQGLRS